MNHGAAAFFEMYFSPPTEYTSISTEQPLMSSVSSKSLDSYPALGLLAVTRAALGCGIGMMVASKFQRSSTRQTTAIALLSVGVLGSLPWLVHFGAPRVNRPEIGARDAAAAGVDPWPKRRFRERRGDVLKGAAES